MKGKEIETTIPDVSDEDRAKEVILSIKKAIDRKKQDLKEAEESLAKVLEKDIKDISEDDEIY